MISHAAESRGPLSRASTLTMFMRVLLLLSLFALSATAENKAENKPHIYRIGFVEAGDHPLHSPFREAFRLHLRQMLAPDSAQFVGKWYWSANWKPDSLAAIAAGIRIYHPVDLVVTTGPMAPEALQAEKVQIPIIAYQRGNFDPVLDTTAGLLRLCYEPDMVAADLTALRALFSPKKIGVVLFADSGKESSDQKFARQYASQLHQEIAFGTGYNNIGLFAFFKAVQSLPKELDAIYLGPLYGLRSGQTEQLMQQLQEDSLLVFCADGRYPVDQGGTAAVAGNLTTLPARIAAQEAARVLRGEIDHGGTRKIPTMPMQIFSLKGLAAAKRVTGDLLLSQAVLTGVHVPKGAPLKLVEAIGFAREGNDQTLARLDEMAAQTDRRDDLLPEFSLNGNWGIVNRSALGANPEGYRTSRGSAYALLEKELPLDLRSGSGNKIGLSARRERVGLMAEHQAVFAYLTLMRERRQQELTVRHVAYVVQGNEAVQARKATKDATPIEQLRWQGAMTRVLARQYEQIKAVQRGAEALAFATGRPLQAEFQLDTLSIFGPHLDIAIADLIYLLDRPDSLTVLAELLALSSLNESSVPVNGASASNTGATLTLGAYLGISDSLRVHFDQPVYGFRGSLHFPIFGSKSVAAEVAALQRSLASTKAAAPAERTERIAQLLEAIKADLLQSRLAGSEQRLAEAAVNEQIPLITTQADEHGDLEQLLDQLFDAEARQLTLLFDAMMRSADLLSLCGWSLGEASRAPLDEVVYRVEKARILLDKVKR